MAKSWRQILQHCPEHCGYSPAQTEAAAELGATPNTFAHQFHDFAKQYAAMGNTTGTPMMPQVIYMPASPAPSPPSLTDTLATWIPALTVGAISFAFRSGNGGGGE